MEGRAPASPVEAASRRLGVFRKRPEGRFYFGLAELAPRRRLRAGGRPPALNFLLG